MDGRDARIAAKRARKQEEAEMASAYERLKEELADRKAKEAAKAAVEKMRIESLKRFDEKLEAL